MATPLLVSAVTPLTGALSVSVDAQFVGTSVHLRLTVAALTVGGNAALIVQGSGDGITFSDIWRHAASDMMLLNVDGVPDRSLSEVVFVVPAFLRIQPTSGASFTLTVEAL